MPKMIRQRTNILFMTTSVLDKLSETAKGLAFLARQAYVNRKFESLKKISERLLPSDVGLYFQAMADSKHGDGDMQSVRKTFACLADSPLTQVRAAARLFWGWDNLRYENFTEAKRLIMQASHLATSEGMCAPLTYINAQNALSVLLAENGAYKESLNLIKNNESLIMRLSHFYPVVLGEYYNNAACSYNDLNELDLAYYYSNKAVSMKVSANYKEWYETRKDIEEKLGQRGGSVFTVPSSYSRSEMLGNLRKFPVPQSYFQVTLKTPVERHRALDYAVNSSAESEARFDSLIKTFEALCGDEKTGYEIEGTFSLTSDNNFEYKNNLRRNKVRDFFKLIASVKSFELANPLPHPTARERADEETVKETLAGLMPLLESTK
jgi:hypothetical protein